MPLLSRTLACSWMIILLGVAACQPATTGDLYHGRGILDPMTRSLNNTPHGYQVIPDPTGTATSETIEKFEVRAGDCTSDGSGWNDCTSDRERSELSSRKNSAYPGATRWYAWDIFVPNNFNELGAINTIIGQFKNQTVNMPPYSFRLGGGGITLNNWVSISKNAVIVPPDELIGQWHRIRVHVRWSSNADGYIKIWANDEVKYEKFGPTMTAQRPIYFKYGIYNFRVSHYEQQTGEEIPTRIVYYDNVESGRLSDDDLPEPGSDGNTRSGCSDPTFAEMMGELCN